MKEAPKTTVIRCKGGALKAMTLEPFLRIVQAVHDASVAGKAVAMMAAVATYIREELFLAVLVAYLVAFTLDWFLGRARAHKHNRYQRSIASTRMLVKTSQVVQCFVLWYLGDVVVHNFVGGGWGSLPGSVLLILVTIEELDSAERNRVALGYRPIPLWSTTIEMFRGITIRSMPTDGPRDDRNVSEVDDLTEMDGDDEWGT